MKEHEPNSQPSDEDISLKQLFSCLPLPDILLKNLASLGYERMTAIQARSLPIMLKGDDIVAKAETGSGKTAAFGLSLLTHLKVDNFAIQALVLCPTRELAEQVSQALRMLARLMPNVKILNLSGGTTMKPQLDSLRHGAHIIVGTPGRIQKHLDKKSLSLDNLQALVLDEADKMLDIGFLAAIQSIITACPKRRQTLLFSATYPVAIKKLCNEFMKNPKIVQVDTVPTEQNIEQRFYAVNKHADKFPLLKALLLHHKPSSTLIFCNTKQQTSQLAAMLSKEGFSTCALNGDMEQAERDVVIVRFANQSCSILVATDVAARGLDIKELPLVINFELAFDHHVHIHRIGRTGRIGNKGLACSLTTPSDDLRIRIIEENLGQPLAWGKITELAQNNSNSFSPEMITLCLNAGKKDKIRPGDILGALTKDAGLPGNTIGKINIANFHAYVAIHKSQIDKAYKYLQTGTLKGRKVSVKKLR